MNRSKNSLSDQSLLRFLTNTLSEDTEFIHKAAEETGFDIVVDNDIYSNCTSHVSVWTNEPLSRDHGPFWQAYRRLKEAAKGGK
jgi:hypothetical protein